MLLPSAWSHGPLDGIVRNTPRSLTEGPYLCISVFLYINDHLSSVPVVFLQEAVNLQTARAGT